MNLDTTSKFSGKTMLLHWLVGLTMLGLLGSGVYMVENEAYSIYPIHKSIGVSVFLFALWRVLWRMRNGWPTPLADASALMHGIARLVHYLLLIGSVLMPISGFLMSVLGGHGVALFGLELVARHPDPTNPAEVIALNGALAGIAHQIHHWSGYALIAGVLLHLSGALKHHFVDKDGTLRRMLGAEV